MTAHPKIPAGYIPEFTYHVTVRWADGTIFHPEHNLDKDAAFDVAADELTNFEGSSVEILRVERSTETGGPLSVRDVTAQMLTERDFAPDIDTACEDCGARSCVCDEAYDQFKEEQLAA